MRSGRARDHGKDMITSEALVFPAYFWVIQAGKLETLRRPLSRGASDSENTAGAKGAGAAATASAAAGACAGACTAGGHGGLWFQNSHGVQKQLFFLCAKSLKASDTDRKP